MKALKQGIYSEFTRAIAESTYYAIRNNVTTGGVTRFYFQVAPQNAIYPNIVYHIDSIRADYTFTTEFADILVVFDIFDDDMSSGDIDDYYTNLRACFDDNTNISVTGYRRVRFKFEWAQQLVEQGEGDEEKIWRYTVQYRVLLEKN